MVTAQGYTIRIAFNANLRAAASLQASIVETAPAGTELNVIGESDRWLQIDRNGATVWMASWVRHERVEGSQQAGGQQQVSNVDNCCFVDRQCNSDQEWTDGYWAFQNGQCTASTQTQMQTQTQTSTQVTTTVSSEIDNCCFVDRQCNSDAEWTDGYMALQNGQCNAPTQSQVQTSSQPATTDPANVNNCCFIGWQCNTDDEWSAGFHAYQSNQCEHRGMAIEGSPGFAQQFHDALDMLRDRAPHWYDYVVRGLDRIRQVLPPTPCCVGVDVQGRTFSIDYTDAPPAGFTYESHTIQNTGMLAHEACHVHRHEAGLESGGYPGEKACLEIQLQVTLEIDPTSSWVQSHQRTLANIDNPAFQWWRSDHPGQVWVPGG